MPRDTDPTLPYAVNTLEVLMARRRGIDLSWLVPILAVFAAYFFLENWTASIAVGLVIALVLMAIDAVRGGVGPH